MIYQGLMQIINIVRNGVEILDIVPGVYSFLLSTVLLVQSTFKVIQNNTILLYSPFKMKHAIRLYIIYMPNKDNITFIRHH